MQWREAEHVRKSYKSIRSKLLDDASKFESIIRSLEEQLEQQQRDIQDLQVRNHCNALHINLGTKIKKYLFII